MRIKTRYLYYASTDLLLESLKHTANQFKAFQRHFDESISLLTFASPLSTFLFFLTLTTEAEHTRALEEQWIESLSPQENTSTSNNDTYSTMLEGVLVGFFLPFLPLFFLSDRSSPSSIASPNWNTRNSGNGRDERIAGHHLNNRSSYVFSEEMKQAIVFGLVSK